MKPLNDHLNLAVEAVHVISRRRARIDQAQTQVQIGLKFHL